MPTFFSHDFPQFIISLDLMQAVAQPGIVLAGATLGELLQELETTRNIRVVAQPDSPKYFRYHNPASDPQFYPVDVHILREGMTICPRQDLSFALLPGDKVEAGVLAC
ncbi:hypothetical protein INH39_19015 [Massilia violaceinigra]|uniref:Uncharacterized protein n=1 Tax=Massilia violaceinigra TaxID=2045208 RepID=A0ABY4A095_9BURK|nr:hypothetical protein [Massilia violaceinigra]UOD27600.1 hypothetical protein INH39_19015 [Massilia violaceinigra]